MFRQSKWMNAIGLLAVLTLASGVGVAQQNNSGPPSLPALNVTVVNTPTHPVPMAPQGTTNVAGTVNVGNTPNVNIANSPSVSIAGTPTVVLAPGGITGVTNTPDGQHLPAPLAISEAMQPYQDTCTLPFSGNGRGFCSLQTIPQGKRLVVEEFDAASGLPPFGLEAGCKPTGIVLTVTADGTPHYFPATFMGNDPSANRDYFATHQNTRLYGSPGVAPQCTVVLSCFSNASYSCQISGFLEDIF